MGVSQHGHLHWSGAKDGGTSAIYVLVISIYISIFTSSTGKLARLFVVRLDLQIPYHIICSHLDDCHSDLCSRNSRWRWIDVCVENIALSTNSIHGTDSMANAVAAVMLW